MGFLSPERSKPINYKTISSFCLFPTSMAFWHQADWHTNLLRYQGARPHHLRVESSSCCFPRELVTFVRHVEVVSFDPWHVMRSPQIRKCIWVGRYNKTICRGSLKPQPIDPFRSIPNLGAYFIREGIYYSRKGIYNCKNISDYQEENFEHFVSPTF